MATSAESTKHSSGYLVAPRVPQGLAAAVEGLTREVIRHRPEDIYVFAAHHFEKLLRLREQYGTSGVPLEKDARTLRDMGLTHLISPESQQHASRGRREAEHSGWSLNQTAKVLKRHRSILSDSDLSAEHFAASTEPQTPVRTPRNHRRSVTKQLTESSYSNDSQSGESEPRNTPKIMARMSNTGMTSRDIKNELRKNRISSRERRSKPRSEEKRKMEGVETPNGRRTKKSEERRRENGHDASAGRITKTPSMDRVKDYVVQRFSTTRSLEELQTVDYVEKVQEIIDETEPIIREKVEELKNDVFRRSHDSRDSDMLENRLNETQTLLESVSSSLEKPSRRSRSARGLRRIRSVSLISTEDLEDESLEKSEEIMISELLIANGQRDGLEVRFNDSRNVLERLKGRRSQSAQAIPRKIVENENLGMENGSVRGEALEEMLSETRDLLAGISSSFVMQNGWKRSRGSGSSSSKSEESDLPDAQPAKVSLPAVRPKSAKSVSRMPSRSDAEDFVLPVISPEAPKSAKVKEDLILPVLSPPGSSSSKEPEIPEIPVEEIFNDSLNVTPEALDLPPRPDSLETEDRCETHPSALKEKLVEIEEAEKNIEKVFGNEAVILPHELHRSDSDEELRKKLVEILEIEKGLEGVLNGVKTTPEPEETPPPPTGEQSGTCNTSDEIAYDPRGGSEISAAPRGSATVATASRGSMDDCAVPRESTYAENNVDAEPQPSPHTYILTEGSPYDIPESITTVIIPEHPATPESGRTPLSRVVEVMEVSESPTRDPSDSFGEEVLPEEPKESPMDFLSAKTEVTIHKQNLQSINEEEGAEEEETLENGHPSLLEAGEETLDVSEDFTRNEGISASSTSAKETSVTDGPMETPKPLPESGEEVTSESGTIESSNEAKETTLTDGTSFSIDPTRPYVPELNLDSLQDITVSSFKMTEDEYDEPGENENTNSFSETLTPDENHKMVEESGGINSLDEGVLDTQSGLSESLAVREEDEEPMAEVEVAAELATEGAERKEVTEEPFVQEFIEVKEPICEKEEAYVTEPHVPDAKIASEGSEIIPEGEETLPKCTEMTAQEVKSVFKDAQLSSPSAEVHLQNAELVFQTAELSIEAGESVEELQCAAEEAESDVELNRERADEEKESESENYVEEDTPLAVSRSASQCTTRRVSSGNLGRLKEDLRLEEGEEDAEVTSDDSKVKFLSEEGEQLESGEDVVVAGEDVDLAGIGDDAEDDRSMMESKEYHIYVPELDQSEDSTTESSFNSAATKIQAGVRGFLTRRRLQRMHHLNSTLNGVPSIQDSIAVDERLPDAFDRPTAELDDAAITIQSNFRGYKARKRLRREDAMQRTTMSMERAFGDEGIRHTGEFHDCIPLPIFDLPQPIPPPQDDLPADGENATKKFGMMFGFPPSVPVLQFGFTPKITQLVDLVVLAKEETAEQSGYLNFITSVEDAEPTAPTAGLFKPPATPGSDASSRSTMDFVELSPRKGVIIEEITSLEEEKILSEIRSRNASTEAPEPPADTAEEPADPAEAPRDTTGAEDVLQSPADAVQNIAEETDVRGVTENPEIDVVAALEAPLATLGFPMKQGKLLHFGSEDISAFHERRPMLEVTLTPGDPMKSLSLSQESQLAGERIESPITMMQIAPGHGGSLLQDDSGEIVSADTEEPNQVEVEPEKREMEPDKAEEEPNKPEAEPNKPDAGPDEPK